jgi:hypothetical protein
MLVEMELLVLSQAGLNQVAAAAERVVTAVTQVHTTQAVVVLAQVQALLVQV